MIPFEDKKYSVIYADPPWSYKCWSKKGTGRSADQHYETQEKDWINNLPVKEISADNCALFLWVTFPCLKQGLETLEAWGFEYKTTAFTWMKQNLKSDSLFLGMGYYTRSNSEICLLGTKGKVLERVNKNVPQAILEHRREHSRKPDCVRDRIVDLFGDVPRIELFARKKYPGWASWGNETNKGF